MMEETLFNFPLQQAGHVGSSEGLMARLSFIEMYLLYLELDSKLTSYLLFSLPA